MNLLRYSLVLLVFLSSVGTAACSESSEISGDLQRAVLLYNEGWHGNDAALLEAMELLSKMRASRTAEPLVRAYFGSAAVARARMVPDWQKRRWLKRGEAELDVAVRMAPENVQVRLLRGVTFAVLPRLAGRIETTRDDYAWLVARAEGGGRGREEGGLRAKDGGPRAEGRDLRTEDVGQMAEDNGQKTKDKGQVFEDEGRISQACRQAIYYHAGSFAMRERDPRALVWLEKAVEIGEAGKMDLDRVRRSLLLARAHFSREDWN